MDTDTAWELWGRRDPYFGVITDPKFRSEAITAQAKEEFFALGTWHAHHVLDTCREKLDPAFAPQRVLDFGCGVGRVAIPFAGIAEEVVAMDISPSMLQEARSNCDSRGVANVSLVLSDDKLSAAEGLFDLVHSSIVLQHIPVVRGRTIFGELVKRIRPGGCGALHVTFGWDAYPATLGQIPPPAPPTPPSPLARVKAAVRPAFEAVGLRDGPPAPEMAPPVADPEMQMNFYSLSELMFILQQAGVTQVCSDITDHGGALGVFMYFQRGPAPAT